MKRLLLLAALALTLPAAATDFASHHLLIPIAGRTPGSFGSQWATDLVVTNAARSGEPVSVQIFFIDGGYINQPAVANLWPRQSANLADVIRATFGKERATGLILVTASAPNAKLTARARIYNTGSPNGQFGQTVQAMPLTKLSTEAFLPGLSGVDGNRTNVGIANPADVKAGVTIAIFDRDGEFRGSFATEVGAYGVLQLNDVFSYFQTGPLDGATIQVRSTHGVYAYASIVRNDSGDADFVAGTGTEIDDDEAVIAPQCASPSQLILAALPAGGYSVLYKPGTNPYVVTPVLESRHGFTVKQIYPAGFFFTEQLTPAQVAALRCESSIHAVEQNGYVPVF